MRTKLLLSALAGLALCASVSAAAAKRPNILIFLADDLGYADVGFTGGKEIRTPNLDALAASGARLDQFYVQPVCSPTRAALMTGRYPMRYGLQVGVVRPWEQRGLPLEERMLPQALKSAGYSTAIVGKWHLGHFERSYLPTSRGFDHQYGHYNGAIDYFRHDRDGGFDWHRDDHACRDEGYSTHLIAREAERLIREQPAGKPFFLYVPFNAVHAPHQVPTNYCEPYSTLPEPRRTYAGMVAAMDEAIGKILSALESRGLRDNTIIIFSSDNGGPQPGVVTSNGRFRAGKGTLYEGGVRVCACVSWKGQVKPGAVIDQPIHMIDWYPTLLKLAGASLEQAKALDGLDILPVLTKGKASPHREILLNTTPKSGAIRAGDWKLVVNGSNTVMDEGDEDRAENPRRKRAGKNPAPGIELFNLARDPFEKENLAEAQPQKVEQLRNAYDALARQAAKPGNQRPPAGYQAPEVWGESAVRVRSAQ